MNTRVHDRARSSRLLSSGVNPSSKTSALGSTPSATSSIPGTSGQNVNFSPRFGIEAEPILNLVQTRLGSYYEPSRFGKVGRQHFTFGADLRLGPSTWWGLSPEMIYKLQVSVDLAPRYESVSFGFGTWR